MRGAARTTRPGRALQGSREFRQHQPSHADSRQPTRPGTSLDRGEQPAPAHTRFRAARNHTEIGQSRPACGRHPAGSRPLPVPTLPAVGGNPMMKCSASLWSADLSNLAAEIQRAEPYVERFHLDVADGHYVPSMLFFPDLVKALRKHTSKPFEVHLMTTDPDAWVEPFVDAGADGVIFCFDSLSDPGVAIKRVKDLGKFVAISLLVTEPIRLLRPYWHTIDQVT